MQVKNLYKKTRLLSFFITFFIVGTSCSSNTADDYYIYANQIFEKGLDSYEKGNKEKADRHFTASLVMINRALEDEPLNISYLKLKFDVLVSLGKNLEALEVIEKAIDIKQNDGKLISLRAEVYVILGEYEKSSHDYNRAIELSPNDPDIHLNYCSFLFSIGSFRDAIVICTKAIDIKPDLEMAYTLREKSYKQLVDQKSE
jgi:tetratricopeptide (TPR) repeat protein